MRRLFGILAFLFFMAFGYVLFISTQNKNSLTPTREQQEQVAEIAVHTPSPEPEVMPEGQTVIQNEEPMHFIRYEVPFVSQAPTAEWGLSEFQNGCEEAATLMVSLWQSGELISTSQARAELITLARFQEKKIGQGVDTDAATTASVLLDQYFDIQNYSLRYDLTLEELVKAVREGVIIVPTNGRALGNPNFTPPGPLQHMVVIIGHDPEKKEFITNDPGTRHGAKYRYKEQILYDAIREYPTGEHLPIAGERKAMILIPQIL